MRAILWAVTVVALSLALPAVPAHDAATRTVDANYTAGTGDVYVRCTPNASLGGACFNMTGFEHRVSIEVQDDLFDRTGAAWEVTNAAGYTWSSGTFCDEVSFEVPNLHEDATPFRLYVFVQEARGPLECAGPAGATQGEVVVSFSGSDATT